MKTPFRMISGDRKMSHSRTQGRPAPGKYAGGGAKSNVFFGGPEEIRTLDFYNANVALSQLSYRPVNLIIITRGG